MTNEAVSPSHSGLKDVACVAIPKILGGFSQLLFSFLLIRSLGPAQFGMVSVCLTSILLLDAVFGSAIDMAIFRIAPLHRELDPTRARQIEKAGLLIKPVASLVLLLPLVVLAPALSELLFQDRTQGPLLLLAYAALVGLLLFRSTQVHFQIERRFVAYGVSDLLHTAARFGPIAVLLAAQAITPERIMGIYSVAALAVTAVGLVCWSRPVLTVPFSMDAVQELSRPLRWYLPTVIAGSTLGRMDLFFLSSVGSVKEAGIYGAAQMFALVPQLLGTYAAAVFSPRILPMWRDGSLTSTYVRYQLLLTGLAVLLFLLALAGTGPLGDWLLPKAYDRSKSVILLLLPTGLAALINFPFTIPLLLYTHPKVLLAADLVAIPLMAVAYLLALPGNGAAVVAALTSACALVRLVFYQVLAWRLLQRDPLGAHWRDTAGVSNPLHKMAGSTV